ncbi:substrate-binding domain-containing protein, partial [Achromobacter insolitus]
VVAELAVDNAQTIADGRAALTRLLGMGQAFDAVFCANDLLAVGALFEARDRKLAIPRDIAILGFGDTDIANEIEPGLTTIGVDSRKLGARAGELLLQRLNGGTPAARQEVFPLTLNQRASA